MAQRDKRANKETELIFVEPPRSLAYLITWFDDLNMDRQSTGFGPATLTSGMIVDWARGKGYWPLRPFDFDTLRLLNRTWMSCWAELNPPPETKE